MRGSHVSSVHSLFGGTFEIFEFIISEKSRVLGKQIREINMKNRGVIAGITSNGKNIIPTGNYTIMQDDIFIVCAGREHLEFINQLFS
jgi:Trk K+ transport system NAD-binding subunit